MAFSYKICKNSQEWDKALEKCPHATVYHDWKFLKIMEKHSEHSLLGRKTKATLYPLICVEGEEPIGLFPLFYYKTPFLRYVFSPPLKIAATYLGPILLNYDQLPQQKRENHALELHRVAEQFIATELKANFIKIRTSPHMPDSRPFIWDGYKVSTLYNYEIDLKGGTAPLWKTFEKTLRHTITKTQQTGMTLEEGTKEDLETLFDRLSGRYAGQGLAIDTTLPFLQELLEKMPENVRLFVIKQDEKYMAGVILLTYRNTVHTWIGMSRTHIRGIYPNDLLMWKTLEWAYKKGYTSYELTWANTYSLCRYKSKYNPNIVPYFSCEKYSPAVSMMRAAKECVTGLRRKRGD